MSSLYFSNARWWAIATLQVAWALLKTIKTEPEPYFSKIRWYLCPTGPFLQNSENKWLNQLLFFTLLKWLLSLTDDSYEMSGIVTLTEFTLPKNNFIFVSIGKMGVMECCDIMNGSRSHTRNIPVPNLPTSQFIFDHMNLPVPNFPIY